MNGAAMNCRQDPGLRPQHRDPASLHNPGYHLQINRQQNLQPQNSKTLNYPSYSNYQVDGYYDSFHQYDNNFDSRHSIGEVEDPRFQRPRAIKRRSEPIDLPVPKFQIDEHSVSLNGNLEGSKVLDLDTRIGLLIKSKALAGLHPIFSDLNDSEESGFDPDDPFLSRPKSKFSKESTRISSIDRDEDMPIRESFDDPERPLSRPPSPFLSRATYLFWFNKAIEIKQQAKAQEQALLEQATKRLMQDTSPSLQANQPTRPIKKPIPKNLIDEISKELKEVIKREFIREVIEQTAFNTLDNWWEKQNQKQERDISGQAVTTNESNESHQRLHGNTESQGSTSPKIPFPWENDTKEPKNIRKEDVLKLACHDVELTETQSSRENHEEIIQCVHSVPKDVDNIPSSEELNEEHETDCDKIVAKGVDRIPSSEELNDKCETDCVKVVAKDVEKIPSSEELNEKFEMDCDKVVAKDVDRIPSSEELNDKCETDCVKVIAKDVGKIPSSEELKDKCETDCVKVVANDVDKIPSSEELNAKFETDCDKVVAKDVDKIPSSEELNAKFETDCDKVVAKDVDKIPSSEELNAKFEMDCDKVVAKDVDKIPSSEELNAKFETDCVKVSSCIVNCFKDEVHSCVSKEHEDSENLLNEMPCKATITCESEILAKNGEMSQLLSSNIDNFQDAKMDEKFTIVKDILDFIFNNVNQIVIQRGDSTPLEKKNEALSSETFQNLASSGDSLLTGNLKPGENVVNDSR